jgi:hypothetical protein
MSDHHEPAGPVVVRARNGDEIEAVKAREELDKAVTSLYSERLRTVAKSPTFPGAEDSKVRESAAQDAFTDLYKILVSDPGRWFKDAAIVATEDVLAEWTAGARLLLSKSVNEDRKQYQAGIEALRLSEDAAVTTAAPDHDESGAGQVLGIDVGLARELFAPLAESDDEFLLLMTLRWFTGSGWEEIAGEAQAIRGGDSIGAPDILVRLTSLLRRDPQGWMALATHCSEKVLGLPDTARPTFHAALELVVERNGWRDPFAPALRDQAVTLLMDWMKRHGKLEARGLRECYEWTADDRRHLAARRIATGFATSPRTWQRVSQRSRMERPDDSGPVPGIWAPPETFEEIARDLPSDRERNAETVQRYFRRMLSESENGWLHYLLP